MPINSILRWQINRSTYCPHPSCETLVSKHADHLIRRTIIKVSAHGKNLIGWIEDDYYFYSHLMMWNHWETFSGNPPGTLDRRERARIITATGGAILFSAPIFQVRQGNPCTQVETLSLLGPDILPEEDEPFDQEFKQRLLSLKHRGSSEDAIGTNHTNTCSEIGAALLNQTIVAGIGNYLRAEILFMCKLDPWRQVSDLTESELNQLCQTIPRIAHRAYETGGVTVSDSDQARMQRDQTLVHRLGSEFGSRHYVFRRTNLPCLQCEIAIRQQKQMIHTNGDAEKTRIIYFCPTCQNPSIDLKPRRTKSHPRMTRANAG